MGSFTKQATVQASTLRNPATAGGIRAGPAPHLGDVRITPLDPLIEMAPEIKERLKPQATPHKLFQTFTEAEDIADEDVLVVGGKRYPIRFVEVWSWKRRAYRRLIIEELKP